MLSYRKYLQRFCRHRDWHVIPDPGLLYCPHCHKTIPSPIVKPTLTSDQQKIHQKLLKSYQEVRRANADC